MRPINFDEVQVGDSLPAFVSNPISRLDLALYAGASGDHNPIHVDLDFARSAGMDDVFAHGMLSMAYLGHVLTNWVAIEAIRSYRTRFVAITYVGDAVTCVGTVVEKLEKNGEQCVRLELTASNQADEAKLKGEALVAVG